MNKKWSIPTIIVAFLLVIGIYASIQKLSVATFILPLAVIAIVLLLVKFPPTKWGKNGKKNTRTKSDTDRYKEAVRKQQQMKQSSKPATTQAKTLPFKVIEGGRDDNDTPRYH